MQVLCRAGISLMSERPWDRPRFKNWIAVARMHALWEQKFGAILAEHGIKVAQFDILANLMHEPGMTQQRLAEKLFVGRSNLSMTLPDLERRGWLTREGDPGDRRVRRLKLTPLGEQKAAAGFVVQLRLLDEMMGVLSDDECNAMGDYTRRMVDFLRKTPRGT
jgi:MarR family transcriptional regulator, organic hydroperoxide resistance regulator